MLLSRWEHHLLSYIPTNLVSRCLYDWCRECTNRSSFLICIPAIAQRVVDNSNLKLLSAQIMEPRPDSVLMSIKSSIKLPIALPVRINPLTLDLLVRDLPGNNTYAKVYIPESTIKTKATLGEDKQPTPLNVPVWSHYVNQVMFQKKVPLSVHGRTLQHLGELHSMITMDKDIQLQGKLLSIYDIYSIHSNSYRTRRFP